MWGLDVYSRATRAFLCCRVVLEHSERRIPALGWRDPRNVLRARNRVEAEREKTTVHTLMRRLRHDKQPNEALPQ